MHGDHIAIISTKPLIEPYAKRDLRLHQGADVSPFWKCWWPWLALVCHCRGEGPIPLEFFSEARPDSGRFSGGAKAKATRQTWNDLRSLRRKYGADILNTAHGVIDLRWPIYSRITWNEIDFNVVVDFILLANCYPKQLTLMQADETILLDSG